MTRPTVFAPHDVEKIRGDLDSFRAPGSYEPGKWMVSALNRRPDVVGDEFPDHVVVRDISLRTIEQLNGAHVSAEGRLRLLSELVRAGVRSVELSSFGRGHSLDQMKAEVDAAKSIAPDCEVVYGDVRSVGDVKMAVSAGCDAVAIWTAYVGMGAAACAAPVYRMAWEGRDWHTLRFPKSPDDQIERSVRMAELCGEHGIALCGSVNLLSFASEDYIAAYTERVFAAGAHEVELQDGSSGCGPEAVSHLVRVARNSAPGVKIAVHMHNGFGLGNACAVAGAKAGATVVEAAVNEYEHGATQSDFAAVVTILEGMYGVDTGIDLGRLVAISRLAEELTGYAVSPHQPIVGRDVFEITGEGYVQEFKVDPLIHCALVPEAFGNRHVLKVTERCGPFTMWDKLDDLGIEVDDPQLVEAVLAACRERLRTHQGALTDDTIRVLAEAVLAQHAEPAVSAR